MLLQVDANPAGTALAGAPAAADAADGAPAVLGNGAASTANGTAMANGAAGAAAMDGVTPPGEMAWSGFELTTSVQSILDQNKWVFFTSDTEAAHIS